MPAIELLVLQPTPFCNIDCSYCYLPNRSSKARMSAETLERVFTGVFSSGWVGEKLDVLWHAGEPLVVPPEYYADALRLAERLKPSGTTLVPCFQTNGTLIDDAWCDFFRQHRVNVGVSIDGPRPINDAHRLTRAGQSTFDATMAGIRRLQRHELPFSVISVLTAASLPRAREYHDFYRDAGIKHVCFNIEEIEGSHRDSSLRGGDSERQIEKFLRELWNLNLESNAIASIREFRQMFNNIVAPAGSSTHNSLVEPFAIVTVDHNGRFSTFAPEFLGQDNDLYDNFIIGDFHKTDLKASAEGEAFKRLSRDVAAGVELCRGSCEFFSVCGGGSPVNKLYENGTIVSTETMYCRLRTKVVANVAMEVIERSAAEEAARPAPDLYIVGTGVTLGKHLTTESFEALSSCRCICTNLADWQIEMLPEELRARSVSLAHLYADNRLRAKNYSDVTSAVMDAVDAGGPVAWLTPGHPRIFDSVSEALIDAGRRRGWEVVVMPSVSCVDTALVELDYDPANGLLVHDATSVVTEDLPLSPRTATLLLQPGVFGSHLAHLSPEFPGTDLTPLRDHLLKSYAPEQRCAFVQSASEPGQRRQISWVLVGDLDDVRGDVRHTSSLFIPAAEWLPDVPADRDGMEPPALSDGGVGVFMDDAACAPDRLQVGVAAARPPVGLGRFSYGEHAIVPDGRWRPLSNDEQARIITRRAPEHWGSTIGVVRVPEELLVPFSRLRRAAREARRYEELLPLAGSEGCAQGVRAFAKYAERHARDPQRDEGAPIAGGIYVRPPGLPTITVRNDEKTLIGLHIDDWYPASAERKHLAPNRICVNLGCEDRFFLFLNVPIDDMTREVARSGLAEEYGGTWVAHTFVSQFSAFPILRLRIRPGEAYIAPTENIIHDASTRGMATIDVSLSIRGCFDLVETVH